MSHGRRLFVNRKALPKWKFRSSQKQGLWSHSGTCVARKRWEVPPRSHPTLQAKVRRQEEGQAEGIPWTDTKATHGRFSDGCRMPVERNVLCSHHWFHSCLRTEWWLRKRWSAEWMSESRYSQGTCLKTKQGESSFIEEGRKTFSEKWNHAANSKGLHSLRHNRRERSRGMDEQWVWEITKQ